MLIGTEAAALLGSYCTRLTGSPRKPYSKQESTMGHRVNRAKDPSSDDHQRCPRVQSTIKEARISRRPASARLTRTSSRHRRDPAFWLGQYYGSSRVRLTSSLLWTRSRSWYVSAHRSLDVLLASTQPLYDLPRASMHRSQRGPRTPRDNLDFDSPASYHEAGRRSWTRHAVSNRVP